MFALALIALVSLITVITGLLLEIEHAYDKRDRTELLESIAIERAHIARINREAIAIGRTIKAKDKEIAWLRCDADKFLDYAGMDSVVAAIALKKIETISKHSNTLEARKALLRTQYREAVSRNDSRALFV